MVTLTEFLSKHGLSSGDRVRAEWKGMHVEGIILPSPHPEKSATINLKLSSGYNTGLALAHISSIQKVPHAERHSTHAQAPAPNAAPHHPSTKPGISIVGVGGTIASKVDYEIGGVTPRLSPVELMQMVPEIGEFAHIQNIVSPFTKASEDFTPKDWIILAHAVVEELKKPDVQGVIVTHGTDTLHFTSAILSFMIRDLSKPVVLVGSQRSSDRGSSDANMNLICAARIAISDIAEVGICMHGSTSDDYCLFTRGTSVRKMHSTRRDAFRPINQRPLLKVWTDGRMEKVSEHATRTSNTPSADAVFDENVALIKVFPGMSGDVLQYYASKGCKGFIIEGTGMGHVNSHSFVPAIQKITAQGIPVFITTQTIYGRVNLTVYDNLRLLKEAGAEGLEDMLPETAYVKLGWVLAHTKEPSKVKEMMLTNYAGEITPFSRTDTFLQ